MKFNKKGDVQWREMAIIILTIVAVVLLLLFATGYWQKLTEPLYNYIGQLNPPPPP